jgi:pimeloyl-ACP methyl ester carboxylesterase
MRRMLLAGSILLAIVVGGALWWLYTQDRPHAVLEAEYARPLSMFLDVAGIRLHVRDTGPRTALGVRGAVVHRMRQQILVDPVALLKRIGAPTLLMWGEKDGMIPFANSADYLRVLPRGTIAALPGIGHLPQEEAPATVSILRQFLDQ